MTDADARAAAGTRALVAGQLPGVRLQVFVVGDYETPSAFLGQGAHNADAANLNL